MQIIIYLLVLIAGMGLSIEAGLLGPLGIQVGHLAATLSIFMIGSIILLYVVFLTIGTPIVGLGVTMTSVLLGQIAMSLVIDHYGLLGSVKRSIDPYRIMAIVMILSALWLLS